MASAAMGPDMTGPSRLALCVYYYDQQDDLILDAVRPALAELDDHVPAYFTRHWHHGPHVRVHLTANDEWARPAAERIGPPLERYLSAHPSRARVDEDTLLAQHRVLAARERMRQPLRPLAPDNSIRIERIPRRAAELDSAAAANLIDDFYLRTHEAACTALDDVRHEATSRSAIGLDLMWTVAATETAVAHPFMSLRSHAEGFISGEPDPSAVRARFDDEYEKRRAGLRRRLRRLSGESADDSRHVSPVVDVLSALRPRILALVRSRAVVPPTTGPHGERRWTDSPFHARLADNPHYRELLRDEGFMAYRVAMSLLYLHLTRLGVTPFQRALLAHLAAGAVEDESGVHAHELLGEHES